MKVSVLVANSYLDRSAMAGGRYPVPGKLYDPEVGGRSFEAALSNARLADDLGFDWVSVSEHHYGPGIMTPNAIVFAGALTQVVKRARIALLGPIVSINNPVRLAEEIALLDLMSGGRVLVFLLRGTPNEFDTYYVKPEETRERAQEAIKLIERALTEPHPFGWEGRYFRFPTVSVWPRPTQTPHPPIFSSGNSPESCVFAARNHHGLAMSFLPPHLVAKAVDLYRSEAAKEGWEPREDQIIYRCLAGIAETEEEAAAQRPEARKPSQGAQPTPKGLSPESWTETERSSASGPDNGREDTAATGGQGFGLGSLAFTGRPDTVVRQIEAFQAQTGVGVLDLILQGDMQKSLRLFGTEVLPRIRSLETSPVGAANGAGSRAPDPVLNVG
jgi:alkanesulfonate monooxygenase SsuD/methylene tetrahydromethanopterin reductase-like flavin-dependent oxidoreductase (luciferase family)